MKKSNTSPEGYSIIIAVLMIGFLIILTTSTLNLVLQEMQDGRGRENYMRAYAWAEWALELALLDIKDKGYGFYREKENIQYFWDTRTDGFIQYDIESETSSYTGSLAAFETDIIPLFTIDEEENKISISTLDFADIENAWLIWNVIGANGKGLSGKWNFSESSRRWLKTLEGTAFQFQDELVRNIFTSAWTYLTVYNPDNSPKEYSLRSDDLFTRPRSEILSSSQVGTYSQNLRTVVDNSEFLGILKYSIYSWN